MTKGEMKRREDMDLLGVRELELQEKLAEEQARRDRITLDNEAKASTVKKLTKSLAKLQANQRKELVGNEDKLMGTHGEKKDVMAQLTDKKERLLVQLESYDVVERENSRMTQMVSQLREELSNLRGGNNAEMKMLRKEMFELRMKIELTFRKTKKSLEEEYEKRAKITMKEESDKAVTEHSRLASVLVEKREEVLDMMAKQQRRENALRRTKIERDIAEAAVTAQEGNIELLEKLQKEQEIIVSRTQGTIAKIHGELQGLKEESGELAAATAALEKERAKAAAARTEAGVWKNRCKKMVEGVEAWLANGAPPGVSVGGYNPMGRGGAKLEHNTDSFYTQQDFNVSSSSVLFEDYEEGGGGSTTGDDDDYSAIWKASKAEETEAAKNGGLPSLALRDRSSMQSRNRATEWIF